MKEPTRRMRNIKRWIMSLLILGITITSLVVVIAYDKEIAKEQQTTIDMDRMVYLEDKEFSALYIQDGTLYAGGTDGLFVINITTNEVEEVMNLQEPFSVVRAIEQTEDGTLWIGHEKGLTGLVNGQVVKQYDLRHGLPDLRINDIEVDGNKLYVATFGGIGVIDQGLVTQITEEDGLIKNITKVLLLDSRSFLWCGSYTSIGGGVTLFTQLGSDPQMTYFSTQNGLSHNAVTTIAETAEGDVWVGNGSYTVGGATRYSLVNGTWEAQEILTVEEGLIGDKVRFIYSDDQGNRWFCSESDGIAMIHPKGDIFYLTKETGLSDNEVKNILRDEAGNYWLASRRGITKIFNDWIEENM